eukprot:3696150-Lingulodinium_polyedra.AAC.1
MISRRTESVRGRRKGAKVLFRTFTSLPTTSRRPSWSPRPERGMIAGVRVTARQSCLSLGMVAGVWVTAR